MGISEATRAHARRLDIGDDVVDRMESLLILRAVMQIASISCLSGGRIYIKHAPDGVRLIASSRASRRRSRKSLK